MTITAVPTVSSFTANFTKTHAPSTLVRYANSTVPITSGAVSVGSQTITTSANLAWPVGSYVSVDYGNANAETVVVTAVTSNGFTANFTKTHTQGTQVGYIGTFDGYNPNIIPNSNVLKLVNVTCDSVYRCFSVPGRTLYEYNEAQSYIDAFDTTCVRCGDATFFIALNDSSNGGPANINHVHLYNTEVEAGSWTNGIFYAQGNIGSMSDVTVNGGTCSASTGTSPHCINVSGGAIDLMDVDMSQMAAGTGVALGAGGSIANSQANIGYSNDSVLGAIRGEYELHGTATCGGGGTILVTGLTYGTWFNASVNEKTAYRTGLQVYQNSGTTQFTIEGCTSGDSIDWRTSGV